MIGPSKILTVSYGTFSCTLEGFDDPFSTMRSIAEYFRDLAADDRYFGAEPPTPDAEMLHRIAEREVQRRVQARVGDNSIVLRQMDGEGRDDDKDAAPESAPERLPERAPEHADAAAAPAARTPEAGSRQDDAAKPAATPAPDAIAATVAAASAAAAAGTGRPEAAPAGTPVTADDASPMIEEPAEVAPLAPAQEADSESVAARLARIRSVVSPAAVGLEALKDDPQQETFVGDPISAAFGDVEEAGAVRETADKPAAPGDEPAADEADGAQDDNAAATQADARPGAQAPAAAQDETADEAMEEAAAEEAEEAASELPASAQAETDFEEDEQGDDWGAFETGPDAPSVARVIKMRREDFEAAVEGGSLAPADDEFSTEETMSRITASLSRAPETDDAGDDTPAGEAGVAGDEIDDAHDFDDAQDAGMAAPAAQAEEVAAERMAAPEMEAEAEPEAEADVLAEVDVEMEPETEAEVLAEVDVEMEAEPEAEPEMEAEAEAEASEESTLSPEDEAELMATLAEVQRQADAEMRAEKEGRKLLETQDIESSAESVSRILEVTNTELEETEGTRRRSAIAHLKAAVAATRADKVLSRRLSREESGEINQYREDLARLVRPRRPVSDTGKPKRRVAPLVLVSELRVNEDTPPEDTARSSSQVVRPRRITADEQAQAEDGLPTENMFVDPGSFAEFAASMGAQDLPDLLEAAAAYTSFVEGNEVFSRPQIMKAVADLKADEPFSREESLRSFGLLLRRGRIRKVKRGQFQIAESTRFRPQQLAAGE